MKSKMIHCYDYKLLPIDQNKTKWRIEDSEIEKELEMLAVDNSKERHISDEIKNGDSVRLKCIESTEESWKDRTILIFPGKELTYAEDTERAVLGRKTGEVIECVIADKKLKLEIMDVIRKHKLEVDDALIEMLKLENVHTIEEYYAYYRSIKENERRTKACIAIVHDWLLGMSEKSEIYIDEEEKKEWCKKRANIGYVSMQAAGYDPRKTPEGEMLTEEKAIENMAKGQERYFVPYVMYQYFCEQDGYILTEKDYLKELEKVAEQHQMKLEDAIGQSDITFYLEKMYQEHTYKILGEVAEQFLEV